MRIEKAKNNCTIVHLTKREIKVLEMLAQGFSAHAISSLLYLNPDKVELLKQSISLKMKTNNLMEALEYALKTGVIKK